GDEGAEHLRGARGLREEHRSYHQGGGGGVDVEVVELDGGADEAGDRDPRGGVGGLLFGGSGKAGGGHGISLSVMAGTALRACPAAMEAMPVREAGSATRVGAGTGTSRRVGARPGASPGAGMGPGSGWRAVDRRRALRG